MSDCKKAKPILGLKSVNFQNSKVHACVHEDREVHVTLYSPHFKRKFVIRLTFLDFGKDLKFLS